MAIRFLVGATIFWIALPVSNAIAQGREDERSITLVGCVMRESQYRDMYGPGLSGPRGAGIGGRNEYVLVDAHEVGAGAASTTNPGVTPSSDTAACPPSPGTFPTAFELTGSREEEVAPYLGRRVEVTGIRKEANARPVGTSGITRPTGGFDPLGHELHLFEVELESVREPALAAAPEPAPAPPVAAAEPAPAPPPAPEPAPLPEPQAAAPPVPEEQIAQQLPRTASPLPLVGLLGLLSLATVAGLRALRRRD
jgi:hypothetical protein